MLYGLWFMNVFNVSADVVAYVDVWSAEKTANYSKPFAQKLQEMGAQVRPQSTSSIPVTVFIVVAKNLKYHLFSGIKNIQ